MLYYTSLFLIGPVLAGYYTRDVYTHHLWLILLSTSLLTHTICPKYIQTIDRVLCHINTSLCIYMTLYRCTLVKFINGVIFTYDIYAYYFHNTYYTHMCIHMLSSIAVILSTGCLIH